MSGETELDVEALARLLARVDVNPPAAAVDRARAILTSEWFARVCRESAAKALEKAANRVAAATHPHSPTFGAYMHAAQIVRTTIRKPTP